MTVGTIFAVENLPAAADALQNLVTMEVVVSTLYHTAGNIGAMVADAFEIGEEIRPDKADFNAAAALLHPMDMASTHFLLEIIDNLFQRLHLAGSLHIA